jgi:hypothetical protein
MFFGFRLQQAYQLCGAKASRNIQRSFAQKDGFV